MPCQDHSFMCQKWHVCHKFTISDIRTCSKISLVVKHQSPSINSLMLSICWSLIKKDGLPDYLQQILYHLLNFLYQANTVVFDKQSTLKDSCNLQHFKCFCSRNIIAKTSFNMYFLLYNILHFEKSTVWKFLSHYKQIYYQTIKRNKFLLSDFYKRCKNVW